MNNTSQHPWSNIYRTSRNKERHFALSMIVVLTCGAVFDVFEINWIVVQDIAAVSLTSLQIQATLVGLSLAIISMISSLSTESCYGISLCDYYMSRKASIFPQKRVVIAAIILVGLGMVFHLFAWYNLVICLLWVSCGLIILSFTMLFSALSGTESAKEEIWQYMDYMLSASDVPFEEKADLFNRYVKAWTPATENAVIYDKENDLFLRTLKSLLKKDDEKALPVIQSACSDLLKRIVYDYKAEMQPRAIDLLHDVYRTIYNYIEENNYKHIYQNFDIFYSCLWEITQCYEQVRPCDFNILPDWRNIADVIDRVNIYCHAEEETDDKAYEKTAGTTSFFPEQEGIKFSSYIKTSEAGIVHYNDYSLDYILQNTVGIPESVEKEYCLRKCQYEFLYYKSLLENGAVDAAVSLLKSPYHWTEDITFPELYFVFLVLIFTWYLAEKESDEFVTEIQRNSAKQALDQLRSSDDMCISVFTTLRWHSDGMEFDSIFKLLHSFLSRQEYIPVRGEMKQRIMNGLVDDFLIFIAAMTCGGREDHPFVNAIITTDIYRWCLHYFNENQDKTLSSIQEMQKTFFPQIQDDVFLQTGLENLSRQAYQVCKAYVLQEAKKNAEEYEIKNQDNALLIDFGQKITDQLRNESRKWFKDATDKAQELEIHLWKIPQIPVDALCHSSVEPGIRLPDVTAFFFDRIGDYLLSSNSVTLFSRNRESDDEDYFNLLRSHQTATMVGSSFAFRQNDFRRYEEFSEITSDMTWVHTESGRKGLLLTRNDIGIEILDGWISTEPVTLDDISCSFDEKTGLYTYSPIAEVPIHFTREELEEYLKNSMIQLVYSVRLRLDIPDGDCGYLIEVG